MITIITTFKNRDFDRVNRHLVSLFEQKNQNFKIIFIDYGSDNPLKLLDKLQFQYIYLEVKNQPWNKSKAINYAVKNIVDTEFCFIADVDMIFAPNFIDKCYELLNIHKAFYFQVAFLKNNLKDKFDFFNPENFLGLSSASSTGMLFFRTVDLFKIGGYDEFIHFYGAEDTDVFLRLQKLKINVYFYNEPKILMVHQWHEKYINTQINKLNKKLEIADIWKLNQLKKNYSRDNNIIKVNDENWGTIIPNNNLNKPSIEIETYCENIDFWLHYKLHNLLENEEVAIVFREPIQKYSFKYSIKSLLKKSKSKRYYTLKQVNDLLILQVINHLHKNPYSIIINDNLDAIIFRLKKIKNI